MQNMFNVLYNRYIEQIKLQEVQNYNRKHKDYLIRVGNFSQNNPQKTIINKNKSISNKAPQRPIKPLNNKNTPNYLNQNDYLNNSQKPPQSKNRFNHHEQQQYPQISSKTSKNHQILSQSQKQSNKFTKQQNIQTNFTNKSPNYNPFPPSQQQRQIQPTQRQISQNNHSKKFQSPLNQFPQQQEDVILQECPQGCGRKFKSTVLQKHIKICQKVFQGKRKPFKVELVDDQAKKLASKSSISDQNNKGKVQKVPKWKKQSEMLRKGLKANQQAGSNQGVFVEQEQDDRTPCPGCGRKFNEQAAKRHIPICMQKSKQRR